MEKRVLIVEDQALIRKSLSALIMTHYPAWEVHEAENGAQAISAAREIQPEIIFMDYRMPGVNGLDASKIILEDLPQTKIIMVSAEENDEFMFEAVATKVSGIVSKAASDSELLAAIEDVINGRSYINADSALQITQHLWNKNKKIKGKKHRKSSLLSDRELEILNFIAKGLSTVQIADKLFISHRTVESHRSNMLKKCNVATTPQLVRFAIRKNLITS
jgi:two-component system, NarL family, response regulator NreC